MADEPRSRWSSIFRHAPAAEIDDELAFHLEQRAREYEAQGMAPEAARQAALVRIGDLEGARRECADLLSSDRRTSERRHRLQLSWLDLKLGIRMLFRYPGLTLVGGIAIAFAIWSGCPDTRS